MNTPSNTNAPVSRRFFRAAGYVFTYERATGRTTVRIEMWREDPGTRQRFWVAVASCAPNRKAAYSAAMALVAWVRSLEIEPRSSVQAQAVAESLALMGDRLANAQRPANDPALTLAFNKLIAGKAAAA